VSLALPTLKEQNKGWTKEEAELVRGHRHVPYLLTPQGEQRWKLRPCKGFIMAFQSVPCCHRRYCVACLGDSTLAAAVDTHDSLGMSGRLAASCSQGTALDRSHRRVGHSYTSLLLPLFPRSLNVGLGTV